MLRVTGIHRSFVIISLIVFRLASWSVFKRNDFFFSALIVMVLQEFEENF